jgi:DNA-binding Xre family transcriptional regulator
VITYAPFFKTIKEKGVSTYALIHKHNISNGTLYRMRLNKPLTTETINTLCNVLKCKVEEIIFHEPDEPVLQREFYNE